MIFRESKKIFIGLILFFIFYNFSYLAKAAFQDDLKPDEVSSFVEEERSRSKAEFDLYFKEQEQNKLRNETVKVARQIKNIKNEPGRYKLGIIFFILAFLAVGLIWFFTQSKNK